MILRVQKFCFVGAINAIISRSKQSPQPKSTFFYLIVFRLILGLSRSLRPFAFPCTRILLKTSCIRCLTKILFFFNWINFRTLLLFLSYANISILLFISNFFCPAFISFCSISHKPANIPSYCKYRERYETDELL